MTTQAAKPPLHVVAGVISNAQNQVLIALRAPNVHQGSLWEFSGGKVEAGEMPLHALKRELAEELNITVEAARPLIQVNFSYGDCAILLDVWRVTEWHGEACGHEGQKIAWCEIHELHQRHFPAANYHIIEAIKLPEQYLITPDFNPDNSADFFYQLERSIAEHSIDIVQFRAKQLADNAYLHYAEQVLQLTERYGTRVLLNTDPKYVMQVGAHGVHLSTQRLHSCQNRPLPNHLKVAASCHTTEDIQQADAISVDFMVVGAVKPTQTHPNTLPLGWEKFQHLTTLTNRPIYALGGLKPIDKTTAWHYGAQGIAAIRGLWEY